MHPIRYLRRHKKGDDTMYTIGGLTGVLAGLIIAVFGLAVAGHYVLESDSLAAVVSAVLVDMTNSDRSANGVASLAMSSQLTAAAQAKADDMAAKGYFAHVSPDGTTPWYWFALAGYNFSYAGENLAVNFTDSTSVEQAWMNSPEHRANILDSNFTQVGIATAQGIYEGQSTTFVVEDFGTPASSSQFANITTTAMPANPTEPALAVAVTTSAHAPVVAGPATTTSPAVLGTTSAPVAAQVGAAAVPWWAYIVTAPKTTLAYAYATLTAVILVLLAVVTGFEWKRHHLRHVAAAGGLLVLMLALFVVANTVFFSTPVLAAPIEVGVG